jgi:MFS transporter, ACS family, hexuronate transporter
MALKIPHLRWWLVGLLFLAAVNNYIDRNLLGLLAPTIQKDLKISDDQYAMVVNLFLVAYTIAYLLSGRVVDALGTRLSMALFVGWWSLSNTLTAFAHSLGSLSVFRFMLGLGEAGGFTASPKAVSEWFPARERGLAIGIYSVGGAVGATVAPLLVKAVLPELGWQGTFAIAGFMGFFWLLPWLWLYNRPQDHTLLTDKERKLVSSIERDPAPTEKPSECALWGEVLRQPAVWMLMCARLMTDGIWYFYQFWMPKYLNTERQVPQEGLSIMWMVFLAADVGFLLGGFLSGRLITTGRSAPASRLWIMLGCALLVPLSSLTPLMPTVNLAIAVAMVVAMAHTAWLSNITALAVDIVPKRILGTSFGLIACGSALGGMAMNQMVAWMIKNYSYEYCFYLMALAHPTALLLIWRLRRTPSAG